MDISRIAGLLIVDTQVVFLYSLTVPLIYEIFIKYNHHFLCSMIKHKVEEVLDFILSFPYFS